MKKSNKIIVYIIILIILICGTRPVLYFMKDREGKKFEQIFKINLPADIDSRKLYDDYCGCPYEGMLLYEYIFTSQSCSQFVSTIKQGDWNRLPMTTMINAFMYGGVVDKVHYGHNFAEKVGLPNINNGYWKVVTKQPIEGTKIKTYNFTLAIYDMDNRILYMFKIDT